MFLLIFVLAIILDFYPLGEARRWQPWIWGILTAVKP
jgi:hypothetical protein